MNRGTLNPKQLLEWVDGKGLIALGKDFPQFMCQTGRKDLMKAPGAKGFVMKTGAEKKKLIFVSF